MLILIPFYNDISYSSLVEKSYLHVGQIPLVNLPSPPLGFEPSSGANNSPHPGHTNIHILVDVPLHVP